MNEGTLQLADGRGFWFAVVDIEVMKDPALSLTDKAIYSILCTFASVGDKRCGHPSIGAISEAAQCSKNTVRTAIKNLVTRGVIEREERFYDGRQTSCLYKIIGHGAYEGSNIEGGRVQILKGGGSKNDRQELEPIELELKELPPISPISEISEISDKPKSSEPKQKATKSRKSTKSSLVVPKEYSLDFERFWKIYPNSKNKQKAWRMWLINLRNKASPEAMIRAAKRYAEECSEMCREVRFILHGSTFLGPDERWKDYDKGLMVLGHNINDDVCVEKYKMPGGGIDAKAYERARRGIDLVDSG